MEGEAEIALQPPFPVARIAQDKRNRHEKAKSSVVEKWCRQFEWAEAARALAEDPESSPLASQRRPEKGDNGSFSQPGRGSNSAAYLVRRLKPDAPRVAEALARGEYKSAIRGSEWRFIQRLFFE
jgi:hypothetical protein